VPNLTGGDAQNWEPDLAYLARYTHRVAISSRRLIAIEETLVSSFRWKDCRKNRPSRSKVI
jgi:hypothetical protein